MYVGGHTARQNAYRRFLDHAISQTQLSTKELLGTTAKTQTDPLPFIDLRVALWFKVIWGKSS
jgi:hypothetical protein